MSKTFTHTFGIGAPGAISTTAASVYQFEEGDKIHIVFYASKSEAEGGSVNNYTASFTGNGSLTISSLLPALGYSYVSCPFLHSASISAPSNLNEIIFSPAVSKLHDDGYTFVPNPLTGSVNPLYSEYGDVNYPFIINRNGLDIVSMYLSDNTYIEYRVLRVYKSSNGLLRIVLDRPLSILAKNDLANGTYRKFLILTQIVDETNAYLIYNKRPGQTSYGFLIPNDLAPDILENIDTITKEIKQKLLANEQGIIEQQ